MPCESPGALRNALEARLEADRLSSCTLGRVSVVGTTKAIETAPFPGPSGQGCSPWRGVLLAYPMRTQRSPERGLVVRVAAYVDGFNLYFGLKAKHGRKYLWLDLQALAASLLRPGQALEQVTYFTARVRNDPDGEQRQSNYLDALVYHSPLVTIINGHFQEKHRQCWQCGSAWTVYEEKETDVSIAVALLEDAVQDRYDTALLISADSDLCPAIRAMKRLRPEKRTSNGSIAVNREKRSQGSGLPGIYEHHCGDHGRPSLAQPPWRGVRLSQAVSVTIRWSRKRRPTTGAARATASVDRRS
jgi:uncharacterized LabA/DUF88 family protein